MLKGTFPVEKFKQLSTPFYYYDVKLLQDTLDVVKTESGKYGYHVHYAVKANANPRILSIIAAKRPWRRLRKWRRGTGSFRCRFSCR